MRIVRFAIIAASLVVVGVSPAYSQAGAPRQPAGGLFGPTRPDVAAAEDKLNFTFQLGEGLESAVPPELASRVSNNLESGGLSTLLAATSDYGHTRKGLRLAATASTAFKYYQDLERLDTLGHSVGVGARVGLPKGNLQFDQAAAYSPSYLYQLFPTDSAPTLGAQIPINPEYQIIDTESFSYTPTAKLAFGSLRGTQFAVTGAFKRTDFDQQAYRRLDLEFYEGGVEVSHRMTSSTRFMAGYDLRSGEFGFGGPTTEHGVTIGAEWSPALSRTRRAIFRLEVTPTRLELPESALNAANAGAVDPHLDRISSEASISYPFRPNWRTAARYRRSVEYLSVLGQPVLSDAGRLELSGVLARHFDVSASAGYAEAASALNPAHGLTTYTGQVALRYAVTRSLALASEYRYYFFDLREQVALVPQMPRRFEQHAVRFGVELFLETIGRKRQG